MYYYLQDYFYFLCIQPIIKIKRDLREAQKRNLKNLKNLQNQNRKSQKNVTVIVIVKKIVYVKTQKT